MRGILSMILFVGLLACGKQVRDAGFNRLWVTIIRAPSSEAEYEAVHDMRLFLLENECSLAIYTVDKAGMKRDIQDPAYGYERRDIASFELHAYWHNGGGIVGKGWKPKQSQHVYNFFLE